MAVTISRVVNSYATRAEANAYLDDSARASGLWPLVGGTDKDRALISAFRELERIIWAGSKSAVQYPSSAVVSAGGTGYSVDDIVTLVGGTGTAATFKVTAEAGGVVSAVAVEAVGGYTAVPANPAATTGGAGDLTLTVTYATQTAAHPRSGMVDREGDAVASTLIHQDIISAGIELAFEISQDTSVEGAEDTGSNIKKVGAGKTGVEFFVSTTGTRYPKVVMDLISPFLGSAVGASSGSAAFGTGELSVFDSADTYERTEGYP